MAHDAIQPQNLQSDIARTLTATIDDLAEENKALRRALRAAWQSRSEAEWRAQAPEAHALIRAALAPKVSP